MVSEVVLKNSNQKLLSAVVLFFLLLNCFGGFRSQAQVLPEVEVKALKQISAKLNNKYWNISTTSCSSGGFNKTNGPAILSNVICNCSFNSFTVCHITNVQLKGLNLTGVLPEEFGDLPYLTEIDFSRNYVSGSIPASWARCPLITISLLGNRISGSIPAAIGSIKTLEELVLEDNQLGGTLPSELGNLSQLRRFVVSANNFTGPIPETFGNLRSLTEFRIDGNGISGKMPNFIGNWTKLKSLDMQGTSLEGPIPSTISLLKNLTELRVTDLIGSNMSFPDLHGMKFMIELILRNCMIVGQIPNYIGEEMTSIKKIDLSFNRLTGEIPRLQSLSSLQYLYLNNNSLTGLVPAWVMDNKNYIDISYNNFTGYSTQPSCESQHQVKTISSSYSSYGDNLVNWCLKKDLPCSSTPKYHSLFINCGGPLLDFNGKEYEDDSAQMGPSDFIQYGERWGCSTTGNYLYNDKVQFITQANPVLNMSSSSIYSTARLSPLSLSVGERRFDISIQGEMRLKDFNIAKEANGTGKSIVKEFDAIVNGSTLEIHLYWSGKGTTFVPDRGVYGPLISAIGVTPNFDPDTGLSVGAIVGIIAAGCMIIVLILVFLWMKGYLGGKDLEDQELRHLKLQKGYFSLKQIKAATGNFDRANKIGEGGFGPVYKGVLSDGTVIAVKQLSSKSKQGNREFINEISMISALQHPNLVKLFGCCIEGNQLLLIYEYMENNSLARALFGREEQRLNLDWPTRCKICMGIARGLAYMHEESGLKIVHRDIKATNVLLDRDLNAKISDFGLAKLDEEENTHISTRVAGTIGYMAPEYAMRGYLTDKADVYSFGVVLLEIVGGKSNTSFQPQEDFIQLLDWAYLLQGQGNLLKLVDPVLESNYSEEEALRMLNLALICTNPSPSLRPAMSDVVNMLEGKMPVQASRIKPGSENERMRFKAFEKLSRDSQSNTSITSQESQVQKSVLMLDSSVSLHGKEDSRDHFEGCIKSSELLSDTN
uniref:non-specific serine/threonine protein kinase n=1 Tax=Nelumbo nucifera TaxID=4432 RepID=A0A822YUG0_NELNU|nr:TPA_asm: hypothetical protein HUJ06_008375 [Nelumbo nucifera]